MSLLDRLKGLLTLEPAVAAWVASGGLAALLITTLHVDPIVAGAIATITSAAATVYTAATTRPVAVPTLVGALVTAVGVLDTFGLTVPPNVVSAAAMVVSAILGLVLRQNLTPTARLKVLKLDGGVYREVATR